MATVIEYPQFEGPTPNPGAIDGACQIARFAHSPVPVGRANSALMDRESREEAAKRLLAPGATRSEGAGNRALQEEPDPFRTCFERDLDRITHSQAYRRLAGKCQVFIAPENDHIRTRLTHVAEVTQIALAIARPAGLNTALVAAAATGHDCGHGPAGHVCEAALSPFVEGGYHHAPYGADVVLAPLNLCDETLDAIRNHSWNRPAPSTPEGEVVAWADRIAYCCHDFEDALSSAVIKATDLPRQVAEIAGTTRTSQLNAFVNAMLHSIASTGTVGMRPDEATALAALRRFNFERIYLTPEAVDEGHKVVKLLRSLTEFFIENPKFIHVVTERLDTERLETERLDTETLDAGHVRPGSPDAIDRAVQHVSGMTDRYALKLARELLGWESNRLPRGIVGCAVPGDGL